MPLGLQGVGKSCLVLRYVRGQFDPSSKVTVGAAFMSHSVKLPSGATIKFEIWYVSFWIARMGLPALIYFVSLFGALRRTRCIAGVW